MSPVMINHKYKPFEDNSIYENQIFATEEKSIHNFSRFNETSLNEPMTNINTFKK